MNIFDQYGIKEVADVTLYSIHKKKDGSGKVYYVPALFLDTLKISSAEKTAENVWAEGGLGNSRLICWDYGKQINVTLEDALCTPASLGLCWGGILGVDWENAKIDHDFGITWKDKRNVEKISRMEKIIFPKTHRSALTIGFLLPQLQSDPRETFNNFLLKSSIVDGTTIIGFGNVLNHTYRWRMFVESDIQSVAVVPDKFFDIEGGIYPIDLSSQLIVNDNLGENKFNIIYKINSQKMGPPPIGNLIIDRSKNAEKDGIGTVTPTEPSTDSVVTISQNKAEWFPPEEGSGTMVARKAQYLCIRIDENNDYFAYFSEDGKTWYEPAVDVILSQFKNLDLWIRFSGINELIYFIITKYENDIVEITSTEMEDEEGNISLYKDKESLEARQKNGKLWAYINPQTMSPYPDDYWFHQGEAYYIKSLTLAPVKKTLNAQKIEVKAGEFPGLYMLTGETFIRNRDTGEDEHIQIRIPMCKVKSEHSITLEAAGDPTVFNLDLEIASPKNGIMMELIAYETKKRTMLNDDGEVEIVDGSTRVLNN